MWACFWCLFICFLLHKHFHFSLCFLWSMLHYSFFHLLCFFVFCFSLSLVYAALFFLSSSFFLLLYFLLSTLHCSFFFLPFCLSHLRPIKKKSMIGATNWLLWVCEFSGCFKLRTEVVVVVGIGGWRKKKRNAWVEVSGFGRKWCEGGKPTGMLDMLLRYGFHKK